MWAYASIWHMRQNSLVANRDLWTLSTSVAMINMTSDIDAWIVSLHLVCCLLKRCHERTIRLV